MGEGNILTYISTIKRKSSTLTKLMYSIVLGKVFLFFWKMRIFENFGSNLSIKVNVGTRKETSLIFGACATIVKIYNIIVVYIMKAYC